MPLDNACVNAHVGELDESGLVDPFRSRKPHRVYTQVLVSVGWYYPQSTVLTFDVEVHGRNTWAIYPQIRPEKRAHGDSPGFIRVELEGMRCAIACEFKPQ